MDGAASQRLHPARPRGGRPDLQFPAQTAELARLAGESDCPVLLSGETGSGKTQIARLIHESSGRARHPFVRVNCGSIPGTLFEREMFGHVRGAFTDAREAAPGYLEAANRGTLFLDEVGELPTSVQSKLLMVLDEGAFRRLGSVHETVVDARIITATNRNLPAMVAAGTFREDLFYRISVIQYRVPPLREDPARIAALVRLLLSRHAGTGPPPEVSGEAMRLIRSFPWPGNVRQLENALRSALVFARAGVIGPEHLPEEVRSAGDTAAPRYAAAESPVHEEAQIREALAAEGGNKTRASRRLGMARSTLWAKLQRYGA